MAFPMATSSELFPSIWPRHLLDHKIGIVIHVPPPQAGLQCCSREGRRKVVEERHRHEHIHEGTPPLDDASGATPEPPQHQDGTYFAFEHHDVHCGTDALTCHVPLIRNRGTRRHHFTVHYTEYDTWMVKPNDEPGEGVTIHGRNVNSNHGNHWRGHALNPEVINEISLPIRIEVVGGQPPKEDRILCIQNPEYFVCTSFPIFPSPPAYLAIHKRHSTRAVAHTLDGKLAMHVAEVNQILKSQKQRYNVSRLVHL